MRANVSRYINAPLEEIVLKPQSTVKIDNVELSKQVVDFLYHEGYELLKDIGNGDGNTRDVFLARFRQGDLDRLRVVKIPKKIQAKSLYLLLNTNRRNIHSNEARVSGKISHPNISEILNHYKIDGLDVLVEDYFDSKSLKQRIKWGPITNHDRLYKIFSQVAEGLKYLHSKGKYHRDVKSSNILIDDNDFVKIDDLQNAGDRDLEDKLLPTRGDSSHTHPSLINSVLFDTPNSAKAQNDIYGFGATLYETITGKIPLDIKLALSNTGKKITIGDAEYFAELKINGEVRDSIDGKEHEKMLKKSLKDLDSRLKDIVYKCMTTTKRAYTSMDDVLVDLQKLQKPSMEKWLNRIYDSLKTAAVTAAGVGIITFGVTYGILHPEKNEAPSIQETLRNVSYMTWSGDSLSNFEKESKWSSLKKTIDEAKKDIAFLEASKKDHPLYNYINSMIEFGYGTHLMDRRLMSGLLHAVSTLDTNDVSKMYALDRSFTTCVPYDFIIKTSMDRSSELKRRPDDLDFHEESAMATMYLKGCIGQSKSVADVYSKYFCDQSEIFSAQERSGTLNYFATQDSMGVIKEGYRKYLPFRKREIIDKAILFHTISNSKDGSIDWNKVPKMYFSPNVISGSDYDTYKLTPE
jgi:serine/threonine protein kinase